MLSNYKAFLAALALATFLAGCATDIKPREDALPQLVVRNLALNPRNGGLSVNAQALQPGDILLSSADALQSLGIRVLTMSPVSHASLYLGEDRIAEAVGHGIQTRSVQQLLDEESTVVAFRHPGVRPDHAVHMQEFARAHVGQKYNLVGVLLHAPFSV